LLRKTSGLLQFQKNAILGAFLNCEKIRHVCPSVCPSVRPSVSIEQKKRNGLINKGLYIATNEISTINNAQQSYTIQKGQITVINMSAI
jgi:hypothetical protein